MDRLKGKAHFNRHCLGNGLTLLVSENHRLPLISISGFVLAGLDQNPLDQPGLAALTSRLIDEGTRTYKAHEISEIIESTGGSLSTFCEHELSGVSLLTTSENFKVGLDLLQEILIYPVFPEDRLLLERQKVLSRLQAMGDDPQLVATNRLNGWIYQGTPLQYPVLGTPECVCALQANELREFHLRKYAPQNTILVMVGAISADEALSESAERFSDWHSPDYSRVDLPKLRHHTEPFIDNYFMEKEQITIYLGHLGITRDNPDYYALGVMDVILGSGPGFTSRIPRRLRDEQGLAYSTHCSIADSSGIYPGRFAAHITTSPENRQRALDGLLFEIENLVENGVTPQELATAQDFLTGNFVFQFQSNAGVAQFLLATELFGLGKDYWEHYPRIIRAINHEDIHRVARQYLDTVNYATVVVGPTHEARPYNRYTSQPL